MNELEKRAQAHSKKKDGLSPFCSLSEDADYYKYITDIKTADNGAESNEEDMATFVKRVTSGNDLVQYVADRIDVVDDKHYLVGYKSDMKEIRFLLGTPGESSSYYNVRHLLKSPYWHISLSLKDELTELYLSKKVDESRKKKKPFDSINTNAGNVEHNIAMFNKMNSPIEGPCTNPVSGPFGGDVGGGEAMGEAVEKKAPILYVIKDSHGNILSRPNEDDNELWDRVSSMEAIGKRGLCVVVCTPDMLKKEELEEARDPYFTPYGYRDAAKVLNGKAPEYYYHLKEIEMDQGDSEKLAQYARKLGLPVVQDPDDDPDYPTFYILGKYHWNDYFYPYPSDHEPKVEESLMEEKISFDSYVEYNELSREEADAASNIDFRIHEEDAVLFIQSGVVDLTTVKEVRYTTTKDDSFDGGYQVILKDGSKKEFGWKDSDREVKLYPLTEAMPPKKETIELEYKNLEFTQYGTKRDVDDWDEWDRCMDWTYEVDKDDLYTFIFESCIDETDFPEAFEDEFDPNNPEHWARFESWLDDNFDSIYSKYEEKILENWEEDAAEEAAEEYDPDDYVDWDSMPGGHDDDRYWEDLNEGEEVFMEKYSYGLIEEYKREPRMIDYFEQMNSEEDEA